MIAVKFMQRYFALKKEKNYFILPNDDYHHILRVMRGKENEHIEVVYENCVYLCALKNVEQFLTIEIDSLLEKGVKEREMIFCIPYLKETKMDFILQKGTEMGASMFILYPATFSMVKIDDKKLPKKLERWNRILKEASEQSKRTNIPQIQTISHLRDLKNMTGVKFLCSTREKEKTIKKFLQSQSNCDKLIVVIGPEGGLSEAEEKQLNEIGFESITLGNRILRVESVPLFVLSCLNYEFME